jgi:hypothetical protein
MLTIKFEWLRYCQQGYSKVKKNNSLMMRLFYKMY